MFYDVWYHCIIIDASLTTLNAPLIVSYRYIATNTKTNSTLDNICIHCLFDDPISIIYDKDGTYVNNKSSKAADAIPRHISHPIQNEINNCLTNVITTNFCLNS